MLIEFLYRCMVCGWTQWVSFRWTRQPIACKRCRPLRYMDKVIIPTDMHDVCTTYVTRTVTEVHDQ